MSMQAAVLFHFAEQSESAGLVDKQPKLHKDKESDEHVLAL